MALQFVFDEHVRGPLWQAALRHNLRGIDPLDVVRVGHCLLLIAYAGEPSDFADAITYIP